MPLGLTVTSLPGWPNITFAAVGEISRPNKHSRFAFRLSPLAHLANSSGDGAWPRSAAQRRTMKPSIIFDSPFLLLRDSTIRTFYKRSSFTLQGKIARVASIICHGTRSHQRRAMHSAKAFRANIFYIKKRANRRAGPLFSTQSFSLIDHMRGRLQMLVRRDVALEGVQIGLGMGMAATESRLVMQLAHWPKLLIFLGVRIAS